MRSPRAPAWGRTAPQRHASPGSRTGRRCRPRGGVLRGALPASSARREAPFDQRLPGAQASARHWPSSSPCASSTASAESAIPRSRWALRSRLESHELALDARARLRRRVAPRRARSPRSGRDRRPPAARPPAARRRAGAAARARRIVGPHQTRGPLEQPRSRGGIPAQERGVRGGSRAAHRPRPPGRARAPPRSRARLAADAPRPGGSRSSRRARRASARAQRARRSCSSARRCLGRP